jgi:hypothetical protein
MTIPISRDPIYRGRRYSSETIELCVRWYISYRLSYRDLAAMMAEREIAVSHTTVMRWVLSYVPEYERRWARFARSPGRLGAWTKRPCRSAAAATSYTERWIGKESPSRHCYAMTEAWNLRRHFFVQPSQRKESLGLTRSISTGISNPPRHTIARQGRLSLADGGNSGAPLPQQCGRAGPSGH